MYLNWVQSWMRQYLVMKKRKKKCILKTCNQLQRSTDNWKEKQTTTTTIFKPSVKRENCFHCTGRQHEMGIISFADFTISVAFPSRWWNNYTLELHFHMYRLKKNIVHNLEIELDYILIYKWNPSTNTRSRFVPGFHAWRIYMHMPTSEKVCKGKFIKSSTLKNLQNRTKPKLSDDILDMTSRVQAVQDSNLRFYMVKLFAGDSPYEVAS